MSCNPLLRKSSAKLSTGLLPTFPQLLWKSAIAMRIKIRS